MSARRCPRPLALALVAAFAAADERVDRLPEEHRVWLEEEVVYIITEAEREVFLGVEGFEEREQFIEAFWARRDPVPATRENEFRIEHYERFDYANRFLGRDAPRPGWQTDRGRYWIILGEPLQREQFDGRNEVVSIDLWIYQGDTSLGLPPRFNLMFFKKEDIGEYELYHPFADGPEALLRRGELLRNRQHAAVDILEIVSMDVARASLVVDLTDPHADFLSATNTISPQLQTVRPSMSVERNLIDIEESPHELVDLEEIEGYLRYGDRVTAEYSFRFVTNQADFRVLVGPRNIPFIHYTVELAPEDFALEFDDEENTYRTTLDVELELRTPDGQLVAMQRNDPVIELTESQHRASAGLPFAYRDNLPVIPGDYEVSVVVRNRATQQYTVASAGVRAAATGPGSVGLSDLVLAWGVDRGSGLAGALDFGTFQFGPTVLEPSVGGVFASSDAVGVAVQAVNAGPEHRIRFRIQRDDAETGAVAERVVPAGSAGDPPIEEFSLATIGPGRYRMVAELLDGVGAVVSTREAPLLVSPRASVERPGLTIRRSFGASVPGLLGLTLGEQLLAHGRISEAVVALREAATNPDLPMARWKLASALLFERRADEALELLLPVEADYPNEIEVAEGVGFAYYLREECGEALPRLEHALTLRTPDTSLLNALGHCHQREGDHARARDLFERSLEMNPDQDGVRGRLAELGEAGAGDHR